MTYLVSTVDTMNSQIHTDEIGRYDDKTTAMKVAKRAARTRRDCVTYGPTSLAYIGREVTAVVAW